MQPTTPAQAWQWMREGNTRFVTGGREHPNQDIDRRAELTLGQNPFAVVFGCSDSRVAAEIVFDRGLGDLFVVRTAGHVVDSGVLGSIEFGAVMLACPLIVVLGHDGCGAVKATLTAHATGEIPGGYVRDVVERVMPSVLTARQEQAGEAGPELIDEVVREHTRHTCRLVHNRSTAIADRVARGECAVIGVSYQLAEGAARLVSVIGDIGDPIDGPIDEPATAGGGDVAQ